MLMTLTRQSLGVCQSVDGIVPVCCAHLCVDVNCGGQFQISIHVHDDVYVTSKCIIFLQDAPILKYVICSQWVLNLVLILPLLRIFGSSRANFSSISMDLARQIWPGCKYQRLRRGSGGAMKRLLHHCECPLYLRGETLGLH